MTRRKRSDELDAALRADPDYRELCRLLDKQTAARKARLGRFLAEQEGETMKKKDLDDRIMELRDQQGLTFSEIASRLLTEGYYFDVEKRSWVPNEVRGRYRRAKAKQSSQPPPPPPPREKAIEEPGESSPVTIPPEWLAPLRKLIREEVQAMMPNAAKETTTAQVEPPPIPRKPKSKEYEGERETLPGCRVDKVLYDKFIEDREKAGSASLVMQKILWTYYGRPKLSFEVDE